MRHLRFLVLTAAVAAVQGCAHPMPPDMAASGADGGYAQPAAEPVGYAEPLRPQPVVVAPAGPDAPYRLDSGDRLRVVVFGQDGLTNSYAVDTTGVISMPLIGAVPARGLTTAELSRAIAARLRQGFMREPHVAVEVEVYRPFFILGEVTFPGQYPYVANMTVETAVAIAGGFSPRAQRDSVDLTRPVNGEIMRARAPVTTPVRPGDTITVSERWF